MYRTRSTTKKQSTSKTHRTVKDNSDTVYLIQNENDILKSKNTQLTNKIQMLKDQLHQKNQNVVQSQRDCEALRATIRNTVFKRDVQLETEKGIMFDKVILLDKDINTIKTKIQQTKAAAFYEKNKIGQIITDKKMFQEEIRIFKTQNQGTKVALIELQKQNDKIRSINTTLSQKKYKYEPMQKQISSQIQQRLRFVKNMNITTNQLRKTQSCRLISLLLKNFQTKRMKEGILLIERFGMVTKIMKKRIFLLSMIRRKYLNHVKSKTLAAFRSAFKPLQQQDKCVRIIQQTSNRRKKAQLWRIWRNQSAKAEYSLIRKFESQNTIYKIATTITKCLLQSSFNILKTYNNHHFSKITCSNIHSILALALRRTLNLGFSALIICQDKQNIQKQIQISAKQHSEMLVMGIYFGAWAKLTKTNKVSNFNIKFRYFRQMKKLIALKKKFILGEMLSYTSQKIKKVNLTSQCFAQLKKEYINEKINSLQEENQKFNNKLEETTNLIQNKHAQQKEIFQELSMLKIAGYWKKQTQAAFNIWRNVNKKMTAFLLVLRILASKQKFIINFAFSRIQKKRFQMLKKSIKDKIQSCEYSYNYLLEQNKHIKTVLDNKTLQLQKTKFVTILKRLVRRQKQVKHKYFYKFLKNGYKCWNVKKSLLRIDSLMVKKIKMVFFFMLKFIKKEKVHEDKINYYTQSHDQKQLMSYYRRSFDGFKFQCQKNKRIKRALGGIFQRNLQIDFYRSFGKMRGQFYNHQVGVLIEQENEVQAHIKTANENIESTEQIIAILTQRLKNKTQTLRERKTMTIYKFFLKNVKKYAGSYITRWRQKIYKQKKLTRFAQILDLKAKSIVKNKFIFALQKNKGQSEITELKTRLTKFKDEYEKANYQFEKFTAQSQVKSLKFKQQNEIHLRQGGVLQKRSDHMNDVKVNSFLRYWGKQTCKFVFRQWKNQKKHFINQWDSIVKMLDLAAKRDFFQKITKQMRFQIVRNRIKTNLSRIYHKKFCFNTGMAFKIWRKVSVLNKTKQYQEQLAVAMKGMEHIQNHFEKVSAKHLQYVDFRINTRKMKKIMNFLRQYSRLKVQNNQRKLRLDHWLRVGYESQFINVLKRHHQKCQKFQVKVKKFKKDQILRKVKIFIDYLYTTIDRKRTISKLFIEKFCFHEVHKIYESGFMRIKNYHRHLQVAQKDRKCYCIQKVIECFEKKRKDILCQNMRIWRRNQYLINMQVVLMKRITRKAMNNKVEKLFYAWKLEKTAKSILISHIEQGQVKKRKLQITRLQKFLDDYKKQKGLLLQNEEGNFVVSPKFQQKKQKQLKRDNILKYKFIARLILSMNGYQAPIKAYNNLQMYMKVRLRYKKAALMVKNRLRNPQLYYGFKVWQNGTKQLRQMFENMERKDLIKILNRQKDKMEMEYTRKLLVEQKVQEQLKRYKILSYQEKKKQRICAQIFFRNARKVKFAAFMSWKRNVTELKQRQALNLQMRGQQKVSNLQAQIEDLQQYERQLRQSNQQLRLAVAQALQIAQLVKRITQERDLLNRELQQQQVTCQKIQEQNQQLNNKLFLAQKQAMNLLVLSGSQI